MKEYQITLGVPDDFDPELLAMDISYKEDIDILSEGFIDEESIKSKIESAMSKCEVKVPETHENDIVLLKFGDNVTPEDAQTAVHYIETQTQKPTIGFVKDIDVLFEHPDAAIEMLNKMIAKIKTRAAVSNKIILPK